MRCLIVQPLRIFELRQIKEKDRVAQMKKQTPPGRLLNNEYAEVEKIFHYLSHLRYHQKPDYDFIRRQFCRSIVSKGVHFDEPYDWEENASKSNSCTSDGGGESIRRIHKSKRTAHRYSTNTGYLG